MCMEGIPCVVNGSRAEGYPCNKNQLLIDDIIDKATVNSNLKVDQFNQILFFSFSLSLPADNVHHADLLSIRSSVPLSQSRLLYIDTREQPYCIAFAMVGERIEIQSISKFYDSGRTPEWHQCARKSPRRGFTNRLLLHEMLTVASPTDSRLFRQNFSLYIDLYSIFPFSRFPRSFFLIRELLLLDFLCNY